MLGLSFSRQFCVLRLVQPEAVSLDSSDQKIGEANPAGVREGTLIDQRHPPSDRSKGIGYANVNWSRSPDGSRGAMQRF